jgi:hypothetical protein
MAVGLGTSALVGVLRVARVEDGWTRVELGCSSTVDVDEIEVEDEVATGDVDEVTCTSEEVIWVSDGAGLLEVGSDELSTAQP